MCGEDNGAATWQETGSPQKMPPVPGKAAFHQPHSNMARTLTQAAQPLHTLYQPATQAIRREAVKELRVCLLPPWSCWCKPYSIAEIPPSWSPGELPRRLVPNHTSASGITATSTAFPQRDWADHPQGGSALEHPPISRSRKE